MNLFNLKQIVKDSTRITHNTSTCIDHVLVNNHEKICQSGVIPLSLSDHMAIFCTRKVIRGVFNKHKTIKIRSLRHYSADIFNEILSNFDWSEITSCLDVNLAWSKFRDKFQLILDQIAPIKEIRIKNRTEPWMSSEILDKIHERDSLWLKFKKEKVNGKDQGKIQDIYKNYSQIRNTVQRDVKQAKSSYYNDKVLEHRQNPKKLWSVLKDLGYSHKTKDQTSIILEVDGELLHDPSDVANHINHFYTHVAATLVNNLPSTSGIYDIFSTKFRNFYRDKGVVQNSFSLKPVSKEFIQKELLNLNTSKSTGLDQIPARFLKDGALLLTKPILHIINLSITTEKVPTDSKLARVKPLFKKKSRLEVGNYRPVAILSVLSKVLERAVYLQLESYLKENNILYELQSGFRRNFSTDTCLIYLSDYIRSQSALGNYTGMALIDVQKAFDTVDHDILCHKLRSMGVASTEWFKSYLSDRRQLVDTNGVLSDLEDISCGVPQGSILGPLLYLCYVNDIQISVSCKLLLYADDAALLVSGKDPTIISTMLGSELINCNKWLIDNRLSIHWGKTECILFGSKRKLKKVKDFKITVQNHTIKSTPTVTYLGVQLDHHLSGDNIVDNIISKSSSRLKFLYRKGNFLDFKTRKLLCSALIQPYFDYCVASWYPSISKSAKHKLQICQNKLVRFILNLGPRSHVGQSELRQVGLLNIDSRASQSLLNHAHSIYYKQCPTYLTQNFSYVADHHDYNTRSSTHNFYVPPSNTMEQNTFFYQAIQNWNRLPSSIKSLEAKSNYKNKVRYHLRMSA